MNLHDQIQLNEAKPIIHYLVRSKHLEQFVVGLRQDQVLAKHKTTVPTQLIVLVGSVEFQLGDIKHRLKVLDVFSIPVNEQHEVKGLGERNIFLITKEKP